MGILQSKAAYAIMSVGKKKWEAHLNKRTKPRTVFQHSPGLLLFFLQRQSTRLAICCPYCPCQAICRWGGKPHPPQQRLKKKWELSSKHLLPLPGIGRTTQKLYHISWHNSIRKKAIKRIKLVTGSRRLNCYLNDCKNALTPKAAEQLLELKSKVNP